MFLMLKLFHTGSKGNTPFVTIRRFKGRVSMLYSEPFNQNYRRDRIHLFNRRFYCFALKLDVCRYFGNRCFEFIVKIYTVSPETF